MPAPRSGRALLVLGLADPYLDADPIPPDRHSVQRPSGAFAEAGPRLCDDPSLQHAFNQFHSNVHHALSLNPPGTEPGPGPEDGAPGLHNGFGAELTFRGC